MKILTLIDFTETARIAVDQAIALAQANNGSVVLGHIAALGIDNEAEAKLRSGFYSWQTHVEASGINCSVAVGYGDFFGEAVTLARKEKPKLIVVGNHGKKGLKQNLFGSNIFKLVQSLPVASVVVNDHTKTSVGGFKKALVPVSPHDSFLDKVKMTSNLLHLEGKLVLLAVMKPGLMLDDKLQENVDKASDYLNENSVNWEYLEVDSTHFSVGFSREILDIAQKEEYDLISLMAEVAEENKNFGVMDKENIILNPDGISVLCVA